MEKVLQPLIGLVGFWKRWNKPPLRNSIVYLYTWENGVELLLSLKGDYSEKLCNERYVLNN